MTSIVSFTEIEQENIINEFLNTVKLKDFKLKLTDEKTRCKCKCYKVHKNYSVLDKFQLPDNVISNIYTYAYNCHKCKNKTDTIERIDNLHTIDNEFKSEYEKLNLLVSEHYDKLKEVKSKNWVPVKQAMMKYQEQIYDGRNLMNEPYMYNPKSYWYKTMSKYENILHIQKHGTRYMCSEERLDKIDFKIAEAPERCYKARHC